MLNGSVEQKVQNGNIESVVQVFSEKNAKMDCDLTVQQCNRRAVVH